MSRSRSTKEILLAKKDVVGLIGKNPSTILGRPFRKRKKSTIKLLRFPTNLVEELKEDSRGRLMFT